MEKRSSRSHTWRMPVLWLHNDHNPNQARQAVHLCRLAGRPSGRNDMAKQEIKQVGDRRGLTRQLFGKAGLTAERAVEAKKVLPRLAIAKDGAAIDGEPSAGAYTVAWGDRKGDARSGAEIVDLLSCLYPEATFEWKG